MKKYFFILFSVLLIFSCNTENENIQEENSESLLNKTPGNTVENIGEYVLSPSKASYDSLLKKGFGDVIFVYYPRKYLSNNDSTFFLEEFGDTIEIPISLVVPLPDSQMVAKGDIVLTWWQNGTGMQRAVVLSKEPTITPVVYYLDNQYYFYYSDNDPTFWIDTLKANSFLKIEDKIMPGRSCSVTGEYISTFYTVINFLGNNIMALSWSGDLEIFQSGVCEIVPFNQNFEVGDSVFTPYLGTFSHGTVKSVFPDIGKMKVTIDFIDTVMVINTSMFDTFKIERSE